MTLEEIARKAEALGLEWVAVCDHSQSLRIAGGVTIDKMKEKAQAVHSHNRMSNTVKLLYGAEVDINSDGSLDYPDEVLEELDFVVAAVHTGFKQDEKTMTARILKAMRHPLVHMIAHPTGRLLGERDPYAVNLDAVVEDAARTGTALEINAYPRRLDLNDVYSRAAKEKGVKLGIGTDAHIIDQMDFLEYGLSVARRGWLEPGDLLNCLGYHALRNFLKEKAANH
jgi:DNA polymerase (family 10)